MVASPVERNIPEENPRASFPPVNIPAATFDPVKKAFDVVTLVLPEVSWLTISVTVTAPPDSGDTETCALAGSAIKISKHQ